MASFLKNAFYCSTGIQYRILYLTKVTEYLHNDKKKGGTSSAAGVVKTRIIYIAHFAVSIYIFCL